MAGSIPSSLNNAVIPELMDSMDYKSMVSSLVKGERKTIKLPSTKGITYTPGQQIEFYLPTNGFLCVNSSTFNFLAKGTGTYADDARFNNHIECIINRLLVTLGDGSSVVEDISEYSTIAAFHRNYTMTSDYIKTIGTLMQGTTSDQTEAHAWFEHGRNYATPLLTCGLFNYNLKYIPLSLLAMIAGYNKSFVFNITLEQNINHCVTSESGGLVGSYEVSDAHMMLDIIYAPEYEQRIMNEVIQNNKVVSLPIKTFKLWPNVMPQTTGYITVPFNDYKQFMQNIITVFRDQDLTTDWNETFILPQYISKAQYRAAGRNFPEQQLDLLGDDGLVIPIRASGKASLVNELLKIFGNKLRKYNTGINFNELKIGDPADPDIIYTDYLALGTTFCTFFDNEDFLNSKGLSLIDGIDTSTRSTSIVLEFRINQADDEPTVYNMYTYTQFMSFIVIDKNSVKVVN